MIHTRTKHTESLRHLGRLISPLDVVYHVGNLIYRRSLRYTVFTIGISLIGVAAKTFDLPGLTLKQAVVLPLTIGGLSLVGGSVLKIIPSLISSRLLTVAQASDLNLMEDYRKSQADEHLRILWDRLFCHECRMRTAAGQGPFPGWDSRPADTPPESQPTAEAEFFARAREALASHLPQIHQMHALGVDLRYLEDWCDGAYLDRSDTKLVEQFEGNATLVAARRDVRLLGFVNTLPFKARQSAQRLWFLFITRQVAIQVGRAVEDLNRQFETDLFNSQVLLWPGEDQARWVARIEGACEAVRERRGQVVRRVFGPSYETAAKVLDHMLYASLDLATELRMRYDPEYCSGPLGYDVMSDLAEQGRRPKDQERARRFVEMAGRDMEAFDAILESSHRDLLAPANAEALRAVRIAFHINKDGLKQALLGGEGHRAAADGEAAELIARASGRKQAYSRLLLAVRMHHELTRLARRGYQELIKALAYTDD